MMYELFERVALAKDVPEFDLKTGDEGVIVETYPASDGLEVEFMRKDGSTIAVLTLDVADVRKVTAAERRASV
jgi:hypothetical protein